MGIGRQQGSQRWCQRESVSGRKENGKLPTCMRFDMIFESNGPEPKHYPFNPYLFTLGKYLVQKLEKQITINMVWLF
jgi:hypothetical protein